MRHKKKLQDGGVINARRVAGIIKIRTKFLKKTSYIPAILVYDRETPEDRTERALILNGFESGTYSSFVNNSFNEKSAVDFVLGKLPG